MSSANINHQQVWAKLHQHQRATRHVHMRDLFEQDAQRFAKMHLEFEHLLLDYSKNRITNCTLDLLCELAHAADLQTWMQRMRTGEFINVSEQRAALHTALRIPKNSAKFLLNGQDILKDVHEMLARAYAFADAVRDGVWRGFNNLPITDVVNIGIGGSDLGPRMASEALTFYHKANLNLHFVSNVDAAHITQTLAKLNPATTLFIIASKSFTTPETLLNAQVAKQWFLQSSAGAAISKHFVAISNNQSAVQEFGIDAKNMFFVWDWVGGRYSTWSAVGLAVIIAIGSKRFAEFLSGGYAMDTHFFSAPFEHNIPVLMALIGVWYNTFYGAHTHAIMPYDHSLRFFPSHLQQLDMESNGKRVGRFGERLDFDTGPVVWGEECVNSQHAFFQLLHQGTRLVPCDFIVPMNSHYEVGNQHAALVANAFAQTEALMRGKAESEVIAELKQTAAKNIETLMPQKLFPGNQPSNTLIVDKITPYTLGMLLALYEHRTFVQGIIWGINSFDQWGVEYGKQLTCRIITQLNNNSELAHDSSTNALINHFRKNHVR